MRSLGNEVGAGTAAREGGGGAGIAAAPREVIRDSEAAPTAAPSPSFAASSGVEAVARDVQRVRISGGDLEKQQLAHPPSDDDLRVAGEQGINRQPEDTAPCYSLFHRHP